MANGDGTGGTDKSPTNVFKDSSQDCREKLSLAGQPDTCKQAAVKTPESTSVHLPGFELSSDATPGTTQKATIDVDGKQRDVWLHLPANYDAQHPTPLMLVFNGVGSGGLAWRTSPACPSKLMKRDLPLLILTEQAFSIVTTITNWPFRQWCR